MTVLLVILTGVAAGVIAPAVMLVRAYQLHRSGQDRLAARRDLWHTVWPVGLLIAVGIPVVIAAVMSPHPLAGGAQMVAAAITLVGVVFSAGSGPVYLWRRQQLFHRELDRARRRYSSLRRPLAGVGQAAIMVLLMAAAVSLFGMTTVIGMLKQTPADSPLQVAAAYTLTKTFLWVAAVVTAIAPLAAAAIQQARLRRDQARYQDDIRIGQIRRQQLRADFGTSISRRNQSGR